MAFERRNLAAQFVHHRVPLFKARRNIYLLTLKGRAKIWPQVKVTWGNVLTQIVRSCYISGDASWQDGHNETRPMSVALSNHELLSKSVGDLGWRHPTPGDLYEGHRQKFGPGSWTIAKYNSFHNKITGSDAVREWFVFSPIDIIGRPRNWPDLRSPIRKIRDVQIVDSYDLITSSDFYKVRSSPAALARRQTRKKVTWRRVPPSDLVTWPWKVRGHHLQPSRKINRLIVMQNFAALRASVFTLFMKNLKGG